MKSILKKLVFVSIVSLLTACGGHPETSIEPSSEPEESQPSSSVPAATTSAVDPSLDDNILQNSAGMKVTFNKLGATISKVEFSGKTIATDGFTVGRCANRIAKGKFTLNDHEYSLTLNDGSGSNRHHLHGGSGKGMNSWRGPFATNDWTKVSETANSIKFSFHSADGDQGYPGNMDMTVTYTLSEQGELSIEYWAKSDADTLCNPTNHLFMTLNGNTSYSNINLQIDADNYNPLVDDTNNKIPDGNITPVEGTKFDYRTEKAFSGNDSYDHNLVLNGTVGTYRKVASMTGTTAKIKVDVYTDRPGLQLYKDSQGKICLETQMLPDMINHSNFASYGTTVLRANTDFSSKTTYHFTKTA